MPGDIQPLPEFPQKDDRSFGVRVARATLGTAEAMLTGGVLGPAVSELIDSAIGLPLEKRRTDWILLLAEGFEEMRQRVNGFDPVRLGKNEEFVSVVAEATQIAMRTHKKEKLEALRNAVLNAAVGIKIDELLRGAFMGYIDRFSPLHLRILALLADPQSDPKLVARAKTVYAGSPISVFRDVYPEFQDESGALSRVLADLNREGLADTSGMMAISTAGAQLVKRTTPVGDAFLRFISDPAEGPA